MHPNPAQTYVDLSLLPVDKETSVVLTDILGQELKRMDIGLNSSNSTYRFDVSEWFIPCSIKYRV